MFLIYASINQMVIYIDGYQIVIIQIVRVVQEHKFYPCAIVLYFLFFLCQVFINRVILNRTRSQVNKVVCCFVVTGKQ